MGHRMGVGAALALAGLGALAGCGEDGGGGGAWEDIEARGDALVNEVQEVAATDPATLPTTGAATYEGVVKLDVDAIPNANLQDADMAGDLELTVNFASSGDAVTGTATNFVGQDDSAYSGTLIVDEGAIVRGADPAVDDVFTAGMAGELTGADGTVWDMSTVLGGDFAGGEHQYVVGTVDGSACRASGCSVVDGGFVGER